MHDKRSTYKVFAIVINDSSPGYQIEIDIFYPMGIFEIIVVNFGFIIANPRK